MLLHAATQEARTAAANLWGMGNLSAESGLRPKKKLYRLVLFSAAPVAPKKWSLQCS
jgi:hypothetical protein